MHTYKAVAKLFLVGGKLGAVRIYQSKHFYRVLKSIETVLLIFKTFKSYENSLLISLLDNL